MSQTTVNGMLRAVPPFNFAHSLKFLEGFRPAMSEQVIADGALTKAVSLDGHIVAFRVRAAESNETSGITYSLYADGEISDSLRHMAEDRIAFFLSLDDDLAAFYALAADDAPFAPIVEKLYGYHQVKFPSPFENACWAIFSTRNRYPIARAMKDRLISEFGGQITVDGSTYRTFPEPHDLVGVPMDDLHAVIRNPVKTTYLRSVIESFAQMDEHWLREADYDAVERWLLSIKGIGAWSASFVMIRGLGRMERLTVPEEALIGAASKVYGRSLNAKDILQLAAPYGDYGGYWAHYVRSGSS